MKTVKSSALFLALITLLTLSFNAVSGTMDDHKIPIADHYEGGKDKLLKDIQAELKYPPNAKRNRRQGTCIVHVKLLEDGSTTNVSIVKNIGAGTGEEAVRIIKTLKFNAPGYSADYNIPVKFSL